MHEKYPVTLKTSIAPSSFHETLPILYLYVPINSICFPSLDTAIIFPSTRSAVPLHVLPTYVPHPANLRINSNSMHLCNPMACQYSYHLHIPSFASVPRRKSTLQPRLYLPESMGLEPTKEQRRNHQTSNKRRKKKFQACALSATCDTNHEEHTAANIRLTNPLTMWAGLDRGL
jgi:hypothetical protein